MKKFLLITLILFGCNVEENLEVEGERVMDLNEMTIEEIVDNLTLREKVGQMIQTERGSIQPHEVTTYKIGSILSGGGSAPTDNTSEGWMKVVNEFQEAALNSSSKIPLIYGTDAVHGNNNYKNAVLFPHNIGLGAANDPDLMYKIGVATSEQLREIGVHWNFSPTIAVAKNPMWGRFYESFSEHSEVQVNLTKSYVEGLQSNKIAATAKHYIGDGATYWDDSNPLYPIDRGNAIITNEQLREIYLPPYIEAIEAGVLTIMTSYNSYNGEKMHGNSYLINDVLKDELGFKGFVITDWEGHRELPGDIYDQVVLAINAGNDMLMEPYKWKETYRTLLKAVENGDITVERVDDAVSRILYVKKELGLFSNPIREDVENNNHYEIAREAVRKSQVLLKNENVLPIKKSANILLIGKGSNSVGLQSGGWSHSWQGSEDHDIVGSSIKDGLEKVLTENGGKLYTDISDADKCDLVILTLSERTYAEGRGDSNDLLLDGVTGFEENIENINLVKSLNLPTLTILIAGRPLLIDEYLENWDAFMMSHLPSSAGEGVTDMLFGDFDFTGKLSYTWPKDISQAEYTVYDNLDEDYQFDYGFGLTIK